MAFFALSQAPPAFAMKSARRTPVTRAPARSPPSASAPKATPTMTGASTATTDGPTISLRAAFVEMSTHVAESGLTPSFPSRRPSISRNWRRISSTIWPAAFPTESMVIAATRNGKPPPISKPITTFGSLSESAKPPTAVEYAAKRASAVRAAEPIANPFPTAAVVFPIESRASVISRTSFPSPPISAMPPALSATGPYASTVIVTPTVASMPIAAIAIP